MGDAVPNVPVAGVYQELGDGVEPGDSDQERQRANEPNDVWQDGDDDEAREDQHKGNESKVRTPADQHIARLDRTRWTPLPRNLHRDP